MERNARKRQAQPVTTAEEATVIELWEQHSAEEIALRINRHSRTVINIGKRFGLPSKARGPRCRVWSADEDAQIIERFPTEGASKLAQDLRASRDTIRSRARDLGIEYVGKVRAYSGPAYSAPLHNERISQLKSTARCPYCEAPPDASWCSHGWDGETTRAMRRSASLAIARELGGSAFNRKFSGGATG